MGWNHEERTWDTYWTAPVPTASIVLMAILPVVYLVYLWLVDPSESPRSAGPFMFYAFERDGFLSLLLSRFAHTDSMTLMGSLVGLALVAPVTERLVGPYGLALVFVVGSMAGAITESTVMSATNRTVFAQRGASAGIMAIGGVAIAILAAARAIPGAARPPGWRRPGIARPLQLAQVIGAATVILWLAIRSAQRRFFERPEWLPATNHDLASLWAGLLIGSGWVLARTLRAKGSNAKRFDCVPR